MRDTAATVGGVPSPRLPRWPPAVLAVVWPLTLFVGPTSS